MPELPDTPASQDALSPAITPAFSSPAAEMLTEVRETEAMTAVTEVVTVPGAPAVPLQPSPAAVQLALRAGWTMAVLYGKFHAPRPDVPRHLPTVNELPPNERGELELDRLRHLLRRLAHLPGLAGSGLPTSVPAYDASEAELQALNLEILKAFAASDPEAELAYQLGRSLRDTANPPPDTADPGSPEEAVARMLARGRVAKLQEWLAALSTRFPQHAAAIVATSLGRWSDFALVTIGSGAKIRPKNGDSKAAAAAMRDYLLPQGELWLMLLTGVRATTGLLTPEGYVAAGEAALGRSARIVRQIIRHYWAAWLLAAIALGGLLYLSVTYLGGAAKVWTSIATVGGTLGITAKSVASTAGRLTAEAERPVLAMAEEDAMAWAITTLPPVGLPPRGARQLRRAGIPPPSNLGRV